MVAAGISIGAIIGIVLGGLAAVLALAAASVWLTKRRKAVPYEEVDTRDAAEHAPPEEGQLLAGRGMRRPSASKAIYNL